MVPGKFPPGNFTPPPLQWILPMSRVRVGQLIGTHLIGGNWPREDFPSSLNRVLMANLKAYSRKPTALRQMENNLTSRYQRIEVSDSYSLWNCKIWSRTSFLQRFSTVFSCSLGQKIITYRKSIEIKNQALVKM